MKDNLRSSEHADPAIDPSGAPNTLPDTRPFGRRFVDYQKERFPFLQHGPLIVVFTFSAAAYSRICRGAEGFIGWDHFILGALTSLYFFFMLRLFDEFKDAEEDARFRPYRPVPRGLITLPELRNLGWILTTLVIAANALVMPRMLPAIGLALGYMLLMSKEFFVRDWLKRHPIIYMISHMIVMPMIDFYTTGLDWLNAGGSPPAGLEFFLIVTFLNGVVIEIGRKIRVQEDEEEGVETYSVMYGTERSAVIWSAVLLLTWISALLAAEYADYGWPGRIALTAILLIAMIPSLSFAMKPTRRKGKMIELASGLWTIGMYLTLGGMAMILRWISSK